MVPEPLKIQEFDGTSWIGVVPFRMEGVMLRPLPDLPGISAFPELNLRLYVELEGKPGVWFLSLDAANPLAVWAARQFFYLPYFWAEMSLEDTGDWIHYRSHRREHDAPFRGRYRPTGPVYESKPGTLENWLTERYCLYAQAPDGRIFRADVHHQPWPLQPAELELEESGVAEAFGLKTEGAPALLHFARKLEVVVWNPRPLTDQKI